MDTKPKDNEQQQQQQQQQSFYGPLSGLPGWASTRRNIYPPTILIIIQSLSAWSHLLRSIASSLLPTDNEHVKKIQSNVHRYWDRLLVIRQNTAKQTWVCEYDGIQKAELNDINMNVTQPLNELQKRRHQLGVPTYMNTLLRRHQQICCKANGSSTVHRSTTHLCCCTRIRS